MAFNLLAMMLMIKHFLFGLNIGFQHLGIKPYCGSIVTSSEDLMNLSRRILLSKAGLMTFLMVRLLQKEGVPLYRDDLRKWLLCISAPCFSLKLCNSSFKPFARIKGKPEYSINQIEILPSDRPSHLVHLQLKTLSTPPKTWRMSDSEYIRMMPQDNRVYVFDVIEFETKELKEERTKATQKSFSICANQGEYYARSKDYGSIVLSFRQVSRFVENAHSWVICAFAFHPKLPILATYSGVEKLLKIWYIPSELSSDPVLISTLNIPDGCVFSIAFHPTLPLIFCGKDNGDIEVWQAV
jgi:WD40 repeat protein